MKIIGITGPTGAGKSLLGNYLAAKGIPVIDADEVYHALLIPPSPCLDALRRTFGDTILFPNGELNRQALSEIVFHDEEKLALLNRTVLDMVLDKIRLKIRRIAKAGGTVVAVDAPTLIESGFDRECTSVVSVLSPSELRIERIMLRDSLSAERARTRVLAQRDDYFYRAHSDYVLINQGNQEEFSKKVEELLPLLGVLPTQ
ncbi:MAG: dephospho-CoA kinase [Clostridia bacterium]|nr:dephospho-CoA kinase [Clostridia bacterium]